MTLANIESMIYGNYAVAEKSLESRFFGEPLPSIAIRCHLFNDTHCECEPRFADQRLQQEMGEPLGSGCGVVYVLQLLPCPQSDDGSV
jgi:hypothetical protein